MHALSFSVIKHHSLNKITIHDFEKWQSFLEMFESLSTVFFFRISREFLSLRTYVYMIIKYFWSTNTSATTINILIFLITSLWHFTSRKDAYVRKETLKSCDVSHAEKLRKKRKMKTKTIEIMIERNIKDTFLYIFMFLIMFLSTTKFIWYNR
jgi:ABC-type Fe3+ transport system permease subunit